MRVDFDRRLKLEILGSPIASDAGLLTCRELDDALGSTAMAGAEPADPRPGGNGRHAMTGVFRQSVCGRLGGYEEDGIVILGAYFFLEILGENFFLLSIGGKGAASAGCTVAGVPDSIDARCLRPHATKDVTR